MEIPVKKLKSGCALPELGLGTWQMGGAYEPDTTNDAAEIAAIRAAIDAGVTHIDTAEVYASGHSEELIQEAVKGIDRKSLFITSKVHPEHHTCEGILDSCTKSLKRLGMKYLDLYLLHSFSSECPLKEAIEALDQLVDTKMVRYIGVSNFTKEHLAEAQGYAKNKIVCDQVYYNLSAREPESSGLLEYCQKNDVMLVAYRPIEKGKLLEDVPPLMDQLCIKYEKSPAQIAINWLMSQDNVVALVKTSNAAHLKENLGAVGWHLSSEDVELIRKEYPGQMAVPEKHRLG